MLFCDEDDAVFVKNVEDGIKFEWDQEKTRLEKAIQNSDSAILDGIDPAGPDEVRKLPDWDIPRVTPKVYERDGSIYWGRVERNLAAMKEQLWGY